MIKNCPYCSEEILATAKKCKHCGEWLVLDGQNINYNTLSGFQPSPKTLINNESVNKYKLLEKIGSGGFATVWKAIQKKLNRVVALKILNTSMLEESDIIRFQKEAQIAASLKHPNIITIYDSNEFDSGIYIEMEYLEGKDLFTMINENSQLTEKEILHYFIPICDALEYAHSNKIIHRDIKSSNIFITKEGRPVLLDFGIAVINLNTKSYKLSSHIGTLAYMSPEQFYKGSIDWRADLFSLGIVLYEAASGILPFRNVGIYDYLIPLDSTTPNWLQNIIYSLLKKNPIDRIQSAGELKELLTKKGTIRLSKSNHINNIGTVNKSKYENSNLKKDKTKYIPTTNSYLNNQHIITPSVERNPADYSFFSHILSYLSVIIGQGLFCLGFVPYFSPEFRWRMKDILVALIYNVIVTFLGYSICWAGYTHLKNYFHYTRKDFVLLNIIIAILLISISIFMIINPR